MTDDEEFAEFAHAHAERLRQLNDLAEVGADFPLITLDPADQFHVRLLCDQARNVYADRAQAELHDTNVAL